MKSMLCIFFTEVTLSREEIMCEIFYKYFLKYGRACEAEFTYAASSKSLAINLTNKKSGARRQNDKEDSCLTTMA